MDNKDISREMKLSKRMEEIVLFAFSNPHLNQSELATRFDVSPQRISQIMKSERVLATFPMLAKRAVKSLVPKAISKLEHLMEQKENYAVSAKMVEKVLDTEHVLMPHTQVVLHRLEMLPIEELQKIVNTAKTLPEPSIEGELIE